MLTVTDAGDNTQTISESESALYATPVLIEHLFMTATDVYRRAVTHWWLFGRETPITVDGDYWVWVGN